MIPKIYQLYEHEVLRLTEEEDATHLQALQRFHGTAGTSAFTLIHNGIRTGSFVGVVQIGNTVLEILPKADRKPNGEEDDKFWRTRLIDMLRVVHRLPLQAPTESHLALKPGAVLHLYFELFVREIEQLLRRGLVRQYHRERRQSTALKGRLLITEQLRHNSVHRERFAVEHDVYDRRHPIHAVLAKAIELVGRLNTSSSLATRLAGLRIDFPEQTPIAISPALFERLSPKLATRKFAPYARAMHIAQLLLLNQHPDLTNGRQPVLALLFDMNALWEGFVAAALRRALGKEGYIVTAQNRQLFWDGGPNLRVAHKPDILISGNGHHIVLDTKWKVLPPNKSPDVADLRQLYAYSVYFKCDVAALVYPGNGVLMKGTFEEPFAQKADLRSGAIVRIPVGTKSIRDWRAEIVTALKVLWEKEANVENQPSSSTALA